ncbi:MAG: lysostaphin resistance A-like protein [Chthoniobacterales bacterium]
MQNPLLGYLLLIPLVLASLYFYTRLARGIFSGEKSELPWIPYRLGDTIFAVILSLLFLLLLTVADQDGQQVMSGQVVLYGIIHYVSLIIFILGFLWFRDLNPLEVFGFRNPGWPRKGLYALGCLLAAYPLISLGQIISYKFFTTSKEPQEVVSFLVESDASSTDRFLVILLAVVVAPIAEELIFRGYLYGVFRKYGGRFFAMIFCALLFASIHLHLPSMLALSLLAIVLTLVYERTGSLWAPILMHATFNGLSVLAAIFLPELMTP